MTIENEFCGHPTGDCLYAAEFSALRQERDALRKALSFYADPTRYHGPNQRLDEPDEWSASVGLSVYRLDVTRDQGAIARAVLGAA